jgi:hypothetical protein
MLLYVVGLGHPHKMTSGSTGNSGNGRQDRETGIRCVITGRSLFPIARTLKSFNYAYHLTKTLRVLMTLSSLLRRKCPYSKDLTGKEAMSQHTSLADFFVSQN